MYRYHYLVRYHFLPRAGAASAATLGQMDEHVGAEAASHHSTLFPEYIVVHELICPIHGRQTYGFSEVSRLTA